ncbi:hypothetical protein TL16_g01060 [Triparma laevis f. inornata]|uniref:EF-hand domain-containing protein n=1 Tax=Triparma laevis f. inornata TaxID=1714386 RepID=A0A9W6ZFQ0_9STRA|nr:hypothetical protein TL16_g01060 [Triparma laevis f. inornata]
MVAPDVLTPLPTQFSKSPIQPDKKERRVSKRRGSRQPSDLGTAPGTTLALNDTVESLQSVLSWKSRNTKLGCDLDITGITYDVKGRFCELVGFDSPTSNDASIALSGDSDGFNGADEETMAIDLFKISPKTMCIVILATSLSGNFTEVAQIRSYVKKVTYMKDEMAIRPGIPLYKTHKIIESRQVFEVGINPSLEVSNNSLIMYKIYRDPENHMRWKTNIVMAQCQTRTKSEIIDKLEIHLGDVFPQKKPENQRLLPDVQSVCTSLSSHALPHLKKYFTMDSEGLSIRAFVKVIFKQLLKTIPGLAAPKEAAHTVAILEELFEQIDINGDTKVDWDEFTSFNIENGMSVTKQSDNADLDEYSVTISQDQSHHDHSVDSLHPITNMIYNPETKRVLTIQKDSSVIHAYNNKGVFAHALNVGEKSDMKSTQDITKQHLTVHDLVFIPSKNLIAIACSDNTIYLYEEQLTAGGIHRKYTLKSTIFEHVLQCKSQIKLAWDAPSSVLYSTGQNNKIYLWDIDTLRCKRVADGHRDMIMHLLIIKEKNFLATCSMDKSIVLWGLENFQKKKTLLGHSHGVRKLAYADSILVSVGFEYEAVVWDIISKEKLFVLSGHKSPIVDVLLLPSTIDKPTMAVTVDDTGEFKTWNVQQSLTTTQPPSQTFHGKNQQDGQRQVYLCILAPFCKELMVDQFSNLLAGSSTFDHFVPIKNRKEFLLPHCLMYNSSSYNFISIIGSRLHLWDATDGSYIRSFADFTNTDITAATTDLPRERRIFTGDETGRVSMLNYITGLPLNESDVHEAEVTSTIFSPEFSVLITTSLDNTIKMTHAHDGELLNMRTIDNAHDGGVATCIFCAKLGVVVSGGHKDSEFKVWDFQRLTLKAVGQSSVRDVVSLAVVSSHALIVACGGGGSCHVWRYSWKGEDSKLEPLCRLGALRLDVHVVTSLSYMESEDADLGHLMFTDDKGFVTSYTLTYLLQEIEMKTGKKVDPVDPKSLPTADSDYMPHLKLTRDMKIYQTTVPAKVDDEFITEIEPENRWQADNGSSIVKALGINKPRSLLVASSTGFMRLFNPSSGLLGEMRLPNVPDHFMYGRGSDSELTTPKPRKMTRRMSYMMRQQAQQQDQILTRADGKKDAKTLWNKVQDTVQKTARLKNTTVTAFGHNFTVKHGVIKSPKREYNRDRNSIRRGGVVVSDVEDSKLTRKNFLTQAKSSQGYEGKPTTAPATSKLSPLSTPGVSPGKSGRFTVSDFNDMFVEESPFDRIKDTGKVPDVPDAFTSRSIHLGALDGVFNFEQVKMLKKVGLFKERRDAYTRAYPVIVPPMLDKMSQLKMEALEALEEPIPELTLPEFAMDGSPIKSDGVRPGTTGVIGRGGKGKGQSRQNWRGYKNLVSEFERSTKNVRRPPITPAGISNSTRAKTAYVAPGNASSNVDLGRQNVQIEMSTELADKLEDDMSDSDEDDGLEKECKPVVKRRTSSAFSDKSEEEAPVRLHRIDRGTYGSSRDFGIKSKHMQHAQHLMDEAEAEEDHTLMHGTHQEIVKKEMAEKKEKKAKRQDIVTEEQEIKRRFSLVMKHKAEAQQQQQKLQRKDSTKSLTRKGSMMSMTDEGGMKKRTASMSSMTHFGGKSPGKKQPLKEKWSQLRQGEFGPNYTLDEVKHFYNCFSYVDQDMSGEIDVDEWQQFLTGMDQEMTATDSRRLFMHIDANHNGVIDMAEICKVVFNRANPDQLRVMVNVMEKTTAAKRVIKTKRDDFSRNDLRQLFNIYDEENEKVVSVKKLQSAFMVLGIPPRNIQKIFEGSGIDMVGGSMDAEEFVDLFHSYLKKL